MKEKKKDEAIVLLNDGEKGGEESHCNSWPYPKYYLLYLTDPDLCI